MTSGPHQAAMDHHSQAQMMMMASGENNEMITNLQVANTAAANGNNAQGNFTQGGQQ